MESLRQPSDKSNENNSLEFEGASTLFCSSGGCQAAWKNVPQFTASFWLTSKVTKNLSLRFWFFNFSFLIALMEERIFESPYSAIFIDVTFSCVFWILICTFILIRSLSLFLHSSLSSRYMALSTQHLGTLCSERALTLASWGSSLVMTLGYYRYFHWVISLIEVLDVRLCSPPAALSLQFHMRCNPWQLPADLFSFLSRA